MQKNHLQFFSIDGLGKIFPGGKLAKQLFAVGAFSGHL